MKFSELGLKDELLESLSYMGFEEATPIQQQAIPIILEGKDLIASAQTGTGKTAAFLLPVLNEILDNTNEGVKVLIVVPTRELAIQIDQQIEGISYTLGVSSLSIYGGGDGKEWANQKEVLMKGADIVVATPGKLISHLNMGYVKFDNVTHLIMDEADRMLDIGFHDDMMKIISFLPKKRQNLMFSATMPPKIVSFAKTILHNPEEIRIAVSKPAEGIMQVSYLAYDNQKVKLIQSLIVDKPKLESIVIFCATKKNVIEIVRALQRVKIDAVAISSDLEQSEREKVMNKFKARRIRVLVATDVISRGIDVKGINLVINYNVPKDPEDYVHRIGRTARADATGVAITFINEDDMFSFSKIESLIEKEIMKLQPPKELGKGPEFSTSKTRKSRGNFKGRRKPSDRRKQRR